MLYSLSILTVQTNFNVVPMVLSVTWRDQLKHFYSFRESSHALCVGLLFPTGSVSFAWKAHIRSFDGCVSVICLFYFPYLYYLNKLSQFIIAWCYHRVSAKSAKTFEATRQGQTIYLAEFFLHTICLLPYQNELHSAIIESTIFTSYATVVYWKRTFSTLCMCRPYFS